AEILYARLGQRRRTMTDFREQLARQFIVLGVDPRAVERIIPADAQEARGLLIALWADAGELGELFAGFERAVLFAMLNDLARSQRIQPGHITQQRSVGRVDVGADVVHAGAHDRLERVLQIAAADVVLIQTDADVLRIDLDQLTERVLQTPADGDG